MSTAVYPRSYAVRNRSGSGASGDNPMIGFHAIKIASNSDVANLRTRATGQWVWLPMPPAGVATEYTQGWDKADASALGSGASQLFSKFFGGDTPAAPAKGNVAVDDFSTVAGTVKDIAVEKTKGLLGAGKGITNRVLEQSYISYSGPGYRSHSFSFSLKPESKADSDEIDKIVKFFKFYGAPILGDSGGVARVYDVPHLFHIELLPNAGLFEFKQSALANVTVKYGGEKYNTFTKGNRPTQTDIGLEFQEMQLLSQKDFGGF